MDPQYRTMIWNQFGAAIDMLENAMTDCPEPLWSDRQRNPEFWHVAFHTLFFLDLYLTGELEGFTPPAPFTLDELNPAGILPERPYSKAELQAYLDHCRRKARATLAALTAERSQERCRFKWLEMSFSELLLYNMRHVQHHAGQLNLILRQQTDSAPRWVKSARA